MKRRFVLGGLWMTTLWSLPAWAKGSDAETPVGQAGHEVPAPTLASPAGETWLAQGRATWYGGKRWQGKRTASGERFDRHALTAAHPNLPMGTWLRVVNLDNGRHVHVRINDRGPHGKRFVIDLSEAAAERLGFRRKGVAQVALHLKLQS